MPLILEQYKRLRSQAAGCSAMLGRIDLLLCTLAVEITVRIIEEPQFVFGLQDAAASLVNLLHRDLSLTERLLQGADIAVGDHIHVGARVQGQGRDLLQVA